MNNELERILEELGYGYQCLATNFDGLVRKEYINKYSNYEHERLKYIIDKIPVSLRT